MEGHDVVAQEKKEGEEACRVYVGRWDAGRGEGWGWGGVEVC